METTTTTNTAKDSKAAAITTLFTLPIHFKRWAADSKGHKDLLALQAAGVIADFDKEVERIVDEETKEVGYKRRSLTFNVQTLDIVTLLAGSGVTALQLEHVQELVNQAMKKDIQTLVADSTRSAPLTDETIPTWENTLAAPFNKRPVAIKVTAAMIEAATKALEAWLVEQGVQEGGRELTTTLCTKKFSIAALNGFATNIIEHVEGLVNGWFDTLAEADQVTYFPVVDLWTKNIDAKLNPKQEEISIDMF